MEHKIKILVVEDEMIIAANISTQLTNYGYEVTGILPRGEDAVLHVQENQPDIVLLDIQLKGKMDGIETAQAIRQKANIPVIYLTANTDQAHFEKAKSTQPEAFISKPFKNLDLQRAIELVVNKIETLDDPNEENGDTESFILSDRIFVRHYEKMIKIFLKDIHYIEADRNYSKIVAEQNEYMLAITLKTLEEKLDDQSFVRAHRSFIVNLAHIDEVAAGYVLVKGKTIPLGKSHRDDLLQKIKMV